MNPASAHNGPLIRCDCLTKTFRSYRKEPGILGAIKGLVRRQAIDHTAVQAVSFGVEEGEFVGFLGPNGAGKTTTLKMLAGLLHPTSGEARVLGFTPWERVDGYRRQFALLLGQKNQLWWDLPAQDSLDLNARIYGIDPGTAARRIQELAELLQVRDHLTTMVRELSLGERMKLELIAALLHAPRVLFLDEPTIGLDVVSQKAVREFLRSHNRRHKTTVLLTSHYMADIQELCARVIIIDRGRIFFDGPLSGIVDRFSDHKRLTLHLLSQDPSIHEPFKARARAFGDAVVDVLEPEPGTLQFKVRRAQTIEVCKALLDAGPVHDMDISEVPVEDVIRQLFESEKALRTNAPDKTTDGS